MTLEEWIITGYNIFGEEAMKSWDKFTNGEIDFKTCVDEMYEAFIDDQAEYIAKEIISELKAIEKEY